MAGLRLASLTRLPGFVCGLSVWEDEGIPERRGGQSKHPEQSLMSIVRLFFSGRLPPTAAQLGPTPLSSPSSASLSLARQTHTHIHRHTHTHTHNPRGLVTIPAGYLLSPSNQHLCNFWPCTSSLDLEAILIWGLQRCTQWLWWSFDSLPKWNWIWKHGAVWLFWTHSVILIQSNN